MGEESIITVSRPEDGYCAWPTLLQRRCGELLAVCSGQRSGHISPEGRVLLYRSADEGETWSKAQRLTSGPLDDRDAGIVELPDGTLVVTWFTSLAWSRALQGKALPEEERRLWEARLREEERAQWRALWQSLNQEQCEAALSCWAIRSTDGGHTWSDPVPTHVGNPHGPILLHDGRLLMVGSLRAENALKDGLNGSPYSSGIGASESRDGGHTWRLISQVPAAEGCSTSYYHEPHTAETSSGRLVMLLRNHCPATHGELLRSFSNDGGLSWSVPSPINRWGYPAHLLTLEDGRLLASFSHRREPWTIRAMMSHDGGERWSDPQLIHEATGVDFGYPSSVHFPDGTFLTLWYERPTDATLAVLKVKRWHWREELNDSNA